MRNPKWVRDELILALDLYFKIGAAYIDHKNDNVIELSKILNTLPIHQKSSKDNFFKNPTGVSMKLRNYQSLDPKYEGGLSNGSKMDKVIWDEFAENKSLLHHIALNIKQGSKYLNNNNDGELEDLEGEEFPEGKVLYKLHNRERNSKLIKKVKNNAKKNGELFCTVCQFSFKETYGEIGEDFIECHHTKPVSEYTEEKITKINDLVLVCSNCHRMLHKKRPWLSIDELSKIVRNNRRIIKQELHGY